MLFHRSEIYFYEFHDSRRNPVSENEVNQKPNDSILHVRCLFIYDYRYGISSPPTLNIGTFIYVDSSIAIVKRVTQTFPAVTSLVTN